MHDELDPGLRRLFAQTSLHPADEDFVSAVAVRTSREGRLSRTVVRLAPALAAALALGAMTAALGVALDQGARMIAPLLTATPAGIAAGLGLVFAGFVCAQTFRSLAGRR